MVKKCSAGMPERVAADLVEIERHDADQLAEVGEQAAAAEAGIHRRGEDAALEVELPEGVERVERRDGAAVDAALAAAGGGDDEDLLPGAQAVGAGRARRGIAPPGILMAARPVKKSCAMTWPFRPRLVEQRDLDRAGAERRRSSP